MRRLGLYVTLSLTVLITMVASRSIIIANYHNILLFFPKELGGNDDLRVIYDVRNSSTASTTSQFKYMPVIVSVAYDSELNQAYAYLESAVTSYIMMLKWAGGRWCTQILFDFPASQFSKYMYHSIVLMENFIYWTTDRFVMSGRIPGYEKRLLLQPAWNRLYSMTADKQNQMIYVAAFDYTENSLFRCSLRIFSCIKLVTADFPINYIAFNPYDKNLYVVTIQPSSSPNDDVIKSDSSSVPQTPNHYLYRYTADFNSLMPVETVSDLEMSSIVFIDDERAVVSNQQSLTVLSDINIMSFNQTNRRTTRAHLIDPYALQYVFTYNHVASFDSYPYPYVFGGASAGTTDYHELLYRNSLFMFYVYACGMDMVENDLAFLPQMDLNSQFLQLDQCQAVFSQDREVYLVPTLVLSTLIVILALSVLLFCLWKSKSKLCGREREKESRAGLIKRGGVHSARRQFRNPLMISSSSSPSSSTIMMKTSSPESSGIGSISSELDKKYYPNMIFYSPPPSTATYLTSQSVAAAFSSSSSAAPSSSSVTAAAADDENYVYATTTRQLQLQPSLSQQHQHQTYPYNNGSTMNKKDLALPPTYSQSSVDTSTTTSNSQRVKFDDFKIQRYVYDQDEDFQIVKASLSVVDDSPPPPHSKIYNQDEITPKKRRLQESHRQRQQRRQCQSYYYTRRNLSSLSSSNSSSLGSMSLTSDDKESSNATLECGELTLDSAKLASYVQRQLNYMPPSNYNNNNRSILTNVHHNYAAVADREPKQIVVMPIDNGDIEI